MEASPARGRATNQEHVLIVRGTAKMCSDSAPLMQNGVPGHAIGVNAMIIARQRETRCHGVQGQGSVGLKSMGERSVRFLRTKQRKTISLCTQKSRFAVSFPAVPVLPLLVPGVNGQAAAKPAMTRVQTYLKEAGNDPARKHHFQLPKS